MLGLTTLSRVVPRPSGLVELRAVIVHKIFAAQFPLPMGLLRKLSIPMIGCLV